MKEIDITKMAWHESGNGKNNNPWGGGNKQNGGPPDLDEVLRKFKENFFGKFFSGGGRVGKGGSIGIGLIFVIIAVLYLIMGFYIVKPQEQAVITRFGKFDRTVQAGPHWLPSFIESKQIVDSEQVITTKHTGSMLTEDENIVYLDIDVQYRKEKVEEYLFKMVNPDRALRQATESALRQVIGKSNLDYIMTTGKSQIVLDIEKQLEQSMQSYESGLFIKQVTLNEVKPPEPVKAAFDDVIKSREKHEELKYQAKNYANKIVPEAEGEAKQLIIQADSYSQRVIADAEGIAAKFDKIALEYKKASKITETRLYIDAMQEVLSNSSKILVDLDSANNLMYLPVDKLMNIRENVNNEETMNINDPSNVDNLVAANKSLESSYLQRRRREGE